MEERNINGESKLRGDAPFNDPNPVERHLSRETELLLLYVGFTLVSFPDWARDKR